MRGIYLSGAARLSTRADAESLGPRAHILGVLNAFRSAGAEMDQLIVGDRVPESFGNSGSEGRLSRNRLTVLAADVMRLGLRFRGRRHLRRESRDRRYDFAYERYALFQELGSRLGPEVFWILEVNALLAQEATSERRATTSRRLAVASERQTFRRADLIVAVTQALKTQIIHAYDVEPDKIVVVENGVDVSRYGRVPAQTSDEARRIGFLGALYPWQNLHELIRALPATNFTLDIAGDGPERGSLEDLIASTGLQHRVKFRGRIHPDDVPEFLGETDICFAGHASANGVYFSPLKLWEYLAAGKVIVASRHETTLALEQAGFPVLTYVGDDAGPITRALQSAAADFPSLRRLAEQSQETVLRQFSWESRIEPVLSIIASRTGAS